MSIWICIIFTYTYNIHVQYCSYIIRSVFFMECARKWMCRHPHRSSRDLHVHLLCILILMCTWHTHISIYVHMHWQVSMGIRVCLSAFPTSAFGPQGCPTRGWVPPLVLNEHYSVKKLLGPCKSWCKRVVERVVGVNTGWCEMLSVQRRVCLLWLSARSKVRKPFDNVHMQCYRADWIHEKQATTNNTRKRKHVQERRRGRRDERREQMRRKGEMEKKEQENKRRGERATKGRRRRGRKRIQYWAVAAVLSGGVARWIRSSNTLNLERLGQVFGSERSPCADCERSQVSILTFWSDGSGDIGDPESQTLRVWCQLVAPPIFWFMTSSVHTRVRWFHASRECFCVFVALQLVLVSPVGGPFPAISCWSRQL